MNSTPHLSKAKQLRKNMTDTEQRLWFHLRRKQICHCKFRRQMPIGSYIVDFVCPEKKLIIELDGGQHANSIAYDHQRTQWLTSQGFHVMRFWNNQINEQMSSVLDEIYRFLSDPPP